MDLRLTPTTLPVALRPSVLARPSADAAVAGAERVKAKVGSEAREAAAEASGRVSRLQGRAAEALAKSHDDDDDTDDADDDADDAEDGDDGDDGMDDDADDD